MKVFQSNDPVVDAGYVDGQSTGFDCVIPELAALGRDVVIGEEMLFPAVVIFIVLGHVGNQTIESVIFILWIFFMVEIFQTLDTGDDLEPCRQRI